MAKIMLDTNICILYSLNTPHKTLNHQHINTPTLAKPYIKVFYNCVNALLCAHIANKKDYFLYNSTYIIPHNPFF